MTIEIFTTVDVRAKLCCVVKHMKRFTDEEKRRIAHNAELTQLNRRLEEKNGVLTREKENLVKL